LYASCVGSIPALPIYASMIWNAVKYASLALLGASTGAILNSVNKCNKRKWIGMNIIFVSIALCVACRELAQR